MQDDTSAAQRDRANSACVRKDVSLRDLLSVIREGVACIANSPKDETHSSANWEQLSIEEILDTAETRVVSGGGANSSFINSSLLNSLTAAAANSLTGGGGAVASADQPSAQAQPPGKDTLAWPQRAIKGPRANTEARMVFTKS